MTASRRRQAIDQAQGTRPGPDDPVVAALRQAESQYRALYQSLEQEAMHTREDLARAHADAERLSNDLAGVRAELEGERQRATQQRQSADHLAAALKDIHRSLFSSNVFDLILKTCLTLTGASRGLYITATAADAPLRVRAAVDVDGYPASAPSAFITSLCRGALENERVSTCNEAARLPERAKDGEAFRNCLVAPVVLLNDLSGVVIVADKAAGDFSERDAEVLLSIGSHAAVALENGRMQHEVEEAYLAIVSVLAETMAVRSQQGRQSQQTGCQLAHRVAERLNLTEHECSVVYYAALLHDVGNVGVSDGVLNKPGPLIDAERELIRAHTQIGHDLLVDVPVLDAVARIVRHHHERFDGSGYPDGLKGEAIPIAARIVAVVDAYGAMLSPRSYRPALTNDQACNELRDGAGTQFDPDVVDAFLAVVTSVERAPLASDDKVEVSLPGLDPRFAAGVR